MLALLLTLAMFLVFWLVGLGVLTALRLDTASLRLVLAAPALGSATMILPLFFLSHAGVPMADCARPVAGVLVLAAAAMLLWRRPRLPLSAAAVGLLCVGGSLLIARPMLRFGFDWVANANDDMANYVLSATQALHHGLLAPFDAVGLSQDRNYATAFQALHTVGARPGSDVMLAALAGVTGRAPYEVFMPLIVALNLCAVCGAAALALQAARRWWAAPVAAALLLASPLATYGVLQQLLPQVWGLALAAAVFALLLRPELHQRPGPSLRQILPVSILVTALFVVYIELGSALVVAYALYVGLLVVKRQLDFRALSRLVAVTVALLAIVVNLYALRELKFVSTQAGTGLQGAEAGSSFGFALLPAALPAVTGFEQLVVDPSTPNLGRWIVAAGILLLAALIASVVDAFRGGAAAVVLAGFAGIGLVLAIRKSDFALFKLYMYVQPFLAAAAGAWLSRARKAAAPVVAGVLVFVVIAQLPTQRAYVEQSRNPIDLRHASDADLLPAFRHAFATAGEPVVSVTEHPVLAKLEAASSGGRPLHFISADIFPRLLSDFRKSDAKLDREQQYFERQSPWLDRRFGLRLADSGRSITFRDNARASAALGSGDCLLVFPSGSQLPFNRRRFPEGSHDLVTRRCEAVRGLLAYTESTVGHGFYFFGPKRQISFYQLEGDYFFPGRTFAGFGRYALFRVLDPSATVRLELNITTTVRRDGEHRLPSGDVIGERRSRLPLLGRGSARVFSKPFRPQRIGGQRYVLLDLGAEPRVLTVHRPGIQGLWGASIPLDPRALTSYIRDVSLVDGPDYRRRAPPEALRAFPGDLANPDLEYSGIYEDGWTAERSYVVLAGGKATELVVRATVLPRAATVVQFFVDGRRTLRRSVAPGEVELHTWIPAASAPRRIELRWAGASRLSAGDDRPASALLHFVGVVPR